MADIARLPPLDELNHLPPAACAAALAPLFEARPDAPFLRALAARRPFATEAAVFDAARAALAQLSDDEQRAVLEGHAPVGADRDAVRRRSALSYREQGYATTGDDAEERTHAREELTRLNAAYRARFGFTFMVFVNRRPPEALVPVLRARLKRTRAEEMATALSELVAIAEDRARTLWREGAA